MIINEKDMKAVVRYKINFGRRSAYIVQYEEKNADNNDRHITATMIDNKTGEKSQHWYFGVNEEGLLELNRVALLDDEDFSNAECDDKYIF